MVTLVFETSSFGGKACGNDAWGHWFPKHHDELPWYSATETFSVTEKGKHSRGNTALWQGHCASWLYFITGSNIYSAITVCPIAPIDSACD